MGVGHLGAIFGTVYRGAVVALLSIPNIGFYAFTVLALLCAIVVALIPGCRKRDARLRRSFRRESCEPSIAETEMLWRPMSDHD